MRKIVVGIFLYIFSIISYGLNFTVYPIKFDVDSKKISTHEIILVNNTLKPLRIKAYPEADVEFGKEYNLNDKITLFPKVVSIKPGASQVIRFRVKPDIELKDGEYKSYLTFEEQPSEIKSLVKETDGNNVSTGVQFITVLSIPIYSLGENQIIDGSLSNIECIANGNGLILKGKTLSKGNTSMNFNYVLDVIGTDKKFEGNLGRSARVGERNLALSFTAEENLKGKKARLKITDQTGKVHFNREIIIK